MPIDPSVLSGLKNYNDYAQADQAFQMQKALAAQQLQTGGIDAASKSNIYATQVLSAATANNDQNAYDQAKQHLQQNGIDVSTWAPDVKSGAQQAQAARLAQSPLGSLLNAGLKADSNVIAATTAMGSQGAGAALDPLSASIAGRILPGLAGGATQNPMMPALAKTESNNNPNAVSPKGAAGEFQIMPATAAKPGYGVTPLQGWDGVDPRTAPQAEQERFANEYLNATQAANGGTSQAGAASYNAGPGAVGRAMSSSGGDINVALTKLPAETQAYVPKVAKFSPPAPEPGDTAAETKRKQDLAFEVYKTNNAGALKQQESEGEQTGKNNAQHAENALGNKDTLRLYSKLGKEASGVPGGILENVYASVTNAANVPSQGAINRGAYDADLNNLYLATIRSLKGTGRIMEAELNKIAEAAPKDRDSTSVKISKVNAHLEDYNSRMNDMGFNPTNGKPISNNNPAVDLPPIPQPDQSAPQSVSSKPPAGAIFYGTSGGKNVYKLPNGDFLKEQ